MVTFKPNVEFLQRLFVGFIRIPSFHKGQWATLKHYDGCRVYTHHQQQDAQMRLVVLKQH
jgi:hypothetical protein